MLHLSHVLPSQNYSNMMGVSSGVGTEDHSRAPEFITDFSGVRVARSLVFCVVLCILLLVLLLFFICLAIVLSVLLRVTDSDYPFVITKLFSFTLFLFQWKQVVFVPIPDLFNELCEYVYFLLHRCIVLSLISWSLFSLPLINHYTVFFQCCQVHVNSFVYCIYHVICYIKLVQLSYLPDSDNILSYIVYCCISTINIDGVDGSWFSLTFADLKKRIFTKSNLFSFLFS
jgi:hypothetical protein